MMLNQIRGFMRNRIVHLTEPNEYCSETHLCLRMDVFNSECNHLNPLLSPKVFHILSCAIYFSASLKVLNILTTDIMKKKRTEKKRKISLK